MSALVGAILFGLGFSTLAGLAFGFALENAILRAGIKVRDGIIDRLNADLVARNQNR